MNDSNEHVYRILAMLAPDQQTWDLSPNDMAAIRWLYEVTEGLLAACEAMLAAFDAPVHLGGTAARCEALNLMTAAVARAKERTER